VNKKVKAYFDSKIEVEKTHPRDWNLKDRFYWIEFLALSCGIRVIMEGKDISGETVCSNDLNYKPHQLEEGKAVYKKIKDMGWEELNTPIFKRSGEETTSKPEGKSKGKKWHHKDNLKGLHK